MKRYKLFLFSILLLLTICFIDRKYIEFLIYWILIVTIINLSVYIKLNNKKIETFIRRTLTFSPLVIPLLLSNQKIKFEINIYGISYFMIFIFLVLAINYSKLKIFFNKEVSIVQLEISQFKPDKFSLYITTYHLILGAIAEELFFREYLFNVFNPNIFIYFIFSSLYFSVLHLISPWYKKFGIKDVLWQLIFSLVACGGYLVSGGIILPIILHITYNSLYCLKMYFYYYLYHKYIKSEEVV